MLACAINNSVYTVCQDDFLHGSDLYVLPLFAPKNRRHFFLRVIYEHVDLFSAVTRVTSFLVLLELLHIYRFFSASFFLLLTTHGQLRAVPPRCLVLVCGMQLCQTCTMWSGSFSQQCGWVHPISILLASHPVSAFFAECQGGILSISPYCFNLSLSPSITC